MLQRRTTTTYLRPSFTMDPFGCGRAFMEMKGRPAETGSGQVRANGEGHDAASSAPSLISWATLFILSALALDISPSRVRRLIQALDVVFDECV